MGKHPLSVPSGFPKLLKEIKERIQQAQTRAILAANAELVRLYWDIGRIIDARQRQEGWGAGVIPRLASDLKNELSEVKGFSERNLDRMIAFYRTYPRPDDFSPPPVAKLPSVRNSPPPVAKSASSKIVPQPASQGTASLLWSVPWAHHVLLMEKVKDLDTRTWYLQQTLTNGWSRSVLLAMIQSGAHTRQGKAITNFGEKLPSPQSDLAQQTLKDPYLFDFLTLQEPFHERELETSLIDDVQRFLMELGQGFAFVGRQHRIEAGDTDYYIDLLFYHLTLRCFVVIDLKKGEFKPEYAGKMNFYLTVVDDKLRNEHDAPSIGLILCQDRNHVIAEYALQRVSSPIGVSQYEFTRTLPTTLKSALPTIEEIEAELTVSDTLQLTDRADAKVVRAKRPTTAKKTKPTAKKQPKKGRKK